MVAKTATKKKKIFEDCAEDNSLGDSVSDSSQELLSKGRGQFCIHMKFLAGKYMQPSKITADDKDQISQ